MDLCAHEQKVDSIKQLINRKISNNFLLKHIEDPAIDDDRIHMLIMAVGDAENHNDHLCITSAMLIQIALDTHDQVTNEYSSLKVQQLTVLAGDYFSGLYYQLLAQAENIDLIRTLAHSVKLINEHKIAIYQLESADIDQYMTSVQLVESNIIEQFCLHFQAFPYSELFTQFLFLKKLLFEKDRFNKGEFSILFNGLKHYSLPQATTVPLQELSSDDQQKLNDICDLYIEKSKEKLRSLSEQATIPSQFKARIDQLANKCKGIELKG